VNLPADTDAGTLALLVRDHGYAHPAAAALLALHDDYLGWVTRSVTRRWHLPPDLHDDVRQEACLALLEACHNFDPKAGTTFGTFAARVVTLRLVDFRRTYRRRARGQKHTREAQGALDHAHDKRELDPAAAACAAELHEAVERAVGEMTPRVKLVALAVADGRSLRSLAHATGALYHVTRRRWRDAVRLLARRLRDHDPRE
jgi:RNA polymerase sigma factor (sigma-70 family)